MAIKTAAVISVDELTNQGAIWAPFADKLAHIREWGYDGVELAVRDPEQVDVPALERALHAAGLPVAALATGSAYSSDGLSYTDPDPAVRQAAMARISAHCALAARIGGLVILGLIRGRVEPGVERRQAEAWMREGVVAACEAAGRVGVEVVFEPINRYETDLVNTVAEGIALVDAVGAGNLGLLLDTFHMNIEEPIIANSVARAGRRVRHMHTSDSNRWYPGAGHLDFSPVIATLRHLGYGGYLSTEILPQPDPVTSLERAAVGLRRLLHR